jgi:hypothetical protein
MPILEEALEVAKKNALLSLGKYWLLADKLNREQKVALIKSGWSEKVLLSEWLIAPSNWVP